MTKLQWSAEKINSEIRGKKLHGVKSKMIYKIERLTQYTQVVAGYVWANVV